jgi:hypothetical protein
MAGSLLMLVAIIWLGVYASGITGYFTTDLLQLYNIAPGIANRYSELDVPCICFQLCN